MPGPRNLRQQGAEIIAGDLLNSSLSPGGNERSEACLLTYPVADGLLEAVAIFAAAARDGGTGTGW